MADRERRLGFVSSFHGDVDFFQATAAAGLDRQALTEDARESDLEADN